MNRDLWTELDIEGKELMENIQRDVRSIRMAGVSQSMDLDANDVFSHCEAATTELARAIKLMCKMIQFMQPEPEGGGPD